MNGQVGNDDAVTAFVLKACFGKTDVEVLELVYGSGRPEFQGSIIELSRLLGGYTQNRCLELVKNNKLSPAPAVLLLSTYLRQSFEKAPWTIYNLVYYLDIMLQSGVKEARVPLALHALLLVHEFPDNQFARSKAHSALTASLADIAPREAIRHGLLSAKEGNLHAFTRHQNLIARLKPDLNLDPLDLVSANALNQLLGTSVSLTEDVVLSTDLASIKSVEIEPAREIRYSLPEGDSSYYIFARARRSISKPALQAYILANSLFSVDLTKTGLPQFYTFVDGACISDLSLGISPFLAEPIIETELPLFILDDRFSSKHNISHFLLDHVPRLLAYKSIHPGDAAVLIVENQPYVRDVMSALGMKTLVTPSERRFTVRAPHLFLTSTMFHNLDHPANSGSERTIQTLRSAFGVQNNIRGSRRILISRADAVGRKVVNWTELESLLQEYGFESVTLSKLSFSTQRKLFSEASHVVGTHGAGLTNLLFAPSACRVLEIMPPLVAAHSYWILSTAVGQRYQAFVADDPDLPRPNYATWTGTTAFNQRDIRVNIEAFRTAITSMLTQ